MKRFCRRSGLFVALAAGPLSPRGRSRLGQGRPSAEPLTAGEAHPFSLELTIRSPYHINAEQPLEDFLIGTDARVQGPAGRDVREDHLSPRRGAEARPLAESDGHLRGQGHRHGRGRSRAGLQRRRSSRSRARSPTRPATTSPACRRPTSRSAGRSRWRVEKPAGTKESFRAGDKRSEPGRPRPRSPNPKPSRSTRPRPDRKPRGRPRTS